MGSLRKDFDVVLAALRSTGLALKYAHRSLRNDAVLCCIAVTQDWRALQWCSEERRADRAVVDAAVSNDGFALQHAHETLKGDTDLVLAAVAQRGHRHMLALVNIKKNKRLSLNRAFAARCCCVLLYSSLPSHGTNCTIHSASVLQFVSFFRNGVYPSCAATVVSCYKHALSTATACFTLLNTCRSLFSLKFVSL